MPISETVSTNSQNVRISSNDQNIWATGDRVGLEWHEYFPIIGGERTELTVGDVALSSGLGKVTSNGDRISWDPEGAYENLGAGAVQTIVITYTTATANGVKTPQSITIEARGAAGDAKTQFVIPETGQTATEAFSIAALDAADVLTSGYQFDTIKPLDIDLDAKEELKDVIDGALSGLQSAVDGAQALLNTAEANTARATTQSEASTRDAFLVNDTLVKLGIAQAAGLAATAATGAFNLASDARDAVRDANIDLAAKRAAEGVAKTAFDIAEGGLNAAIIAETNARAALSTATSVAADAVSAVNSAQAAVSNFVLDIFNFLTFGALEDELDEARAVLRQAEAQVERATRTAENAVENLTSKQSIFNGAQAELDAAEAATIRASNFAIDKAADLTDALAGQTLSGLERLSREAEAASDTADQNYFAARQAMWDEGLLVNRNPTPGDVVSFNATAAADLAALGLAETEEGLASAAVFTAQGVYDVAFAAIDSTDLIIDAEASVDVSAQAGLQIDLVLDAGSVDSDIDYRLDTTTEYDAGDDTLTIMAEATNATTGVSVAFETVSPNLQFYAGIAYNVIADFELSLDLYAELLGAELFDFPSGNDPFTFSEQLQLDGWIDIIDFDSTDAESINVPIPGWVGDILEIELNFPTVETKGVETDVSADLYTDPTGFSMDELTDAILNITEAKLDFSPEFRALMVERGASADVTATDLGDALSEALGAILDSIVGEGDTDGDGVVPIFLLDNTDAGVDGLFHINNIDDVISEIDINDVGELGFFYAEGTSDNIVQVTVDIDQLVATAINVALGNSPSSTINPLDLSIGLSDFFEKSSVSPEAQAAIEKFVSVEFGFEVADFDVRAGANFSQKFALSVDDMDFNVTFEDGTTGTFSADEGGALVIDNASDLVDTNNDGAIDYTMSLTPDATFFNDTQIGLNLGYTLDFIKAKAEFMAGLPLNDIFDLTELDGTFGFESTFGPLLRLDGDLDVLSADIFEDIFAYNAGSASVAGSIALTGADDTLVGDNTANSLQGGAGNDQLDGGGGNDILDGGIGIDRLLGGAGDDTLFGGAGNDLLGGGAGADTMDGGLGNDFYIVDNVRDVVTEANAFSAGGGIDTVRAFIDYVQPNNIELVRLGNVDGRANLNATGNDAPGTLVGNAGNNVLIGRGGNDQINGNGGDDRLTGNTGRDTLVGGEGADTFIYNSISESRVGIVERDVINGFDRGADKIDLSAMDANLGFAGDAEFTFIGRNQFDGDGASSAGQLRLQSLGGPNAVLVEGDLRGDGVADFQIFVNLTTQLGADDFIL